jgi:hypothetical protein
MTTVQEIEHAIELLPSDQFSQVHDWIVEKTGRRGMRRLSATAPTAA